MGSVIGLLLTALLAGCGGRVQSVSCNECAAEIGPNDAQFASPDTLVSDVAVMADSTTPIDSSIPDGSIESDASPQADGPSDAAPQPDGRGDTSLDAADVMLAETGCGRDGSACTEAGLPLYAIVVDRKSYLGEGYPAYTVSLSGFYADGTPSTESVVLTTTRSGVGALNPSASQPLAEGEGWASFTPCDVANTPSCAGEFQFTLALASDPTHPVAASIPVEISVPAPVGDVSPCAGPGNILYMFGDPASPQPGPVTITGASWTGNPLYSVAGPTPATSVVSGIDVTAAPDPTDPAKQWSVSVTTVYSPFSVGTYDFTTVGGLLNASYPSMTLWIPTDCSAIGAGRFQVHEATFGGADTMTVLLSFGLNCETGSGGMAPITGCLRYSQ
ncbi:MAG: hypothetical protein ACHREM_17905 [Polyangiales bacterium]